MKRPPRIEIFVDGAPALTAEQAAARKGVKLDSMHAALTRYKDQIRPAADLDGRKKLYLTTELDEWWENRPGKGAPGVAKPHKAGTPPQPQGQKT